MVKFHT